MTRNGAPTGTIIALTVLMAGVVFLLLGGLAKAPLIQAAARGLAAAPTVNGLSTYPGVVNSPGSWTAVPLVRTDGSYDTIVHLANLSASAPAAVSVTFYNEDGSQQSQLSATVAPLGSQDVDVGSSLSGPFNGAAVVTSTNDLAVVADLLDGPLAIDNLASYPGDPTGSTQIDVPLVYKANSGFDSLVRLQNTSPASATASLAFVPSVGSTGSMTTTVSIPPNASTDVDVGSIAGFPSGQWVGNLTIQSDQTLAAVCLQISSLTMESSPAIDLPSVTTTSTTAARVNPHPIGRPSPPASARALSPAASGMPSTFYYPRVQSREDPDWISGFSVYNPTTTTANLNFGFFNPDGSAQSQSGSVALAPAESYLLYPVSKVAGTTLSGSAVITSDQPTILSILNNEAYQGPDNARMYGPLTSVIGQTSAPSGATTTLLALRSSAAPNVSTGIALFNDQPSTQTYRIAYYNQTGTEVKADTTTLMPNAQAYFAQGCDPTLPPGYSGLAQITNTSGGPPPVAVVELEGSESLPPGTIPTCPPATPTATWSATPTQTPTATFTPTPPSVALTPGVPTTVATMVGALNVSVELPESAASPPITGLQINSLATPFPAIAPDRVFSAVTGAQVALSARSADGESISVLNLPATLSLTLAAPPGTNPRLGRIYTVDRGGNLIWLPTESIPGPGTAFTWRATVNYFSSFAVYLPGSGTPVPQSNLPLFAAAVPAPVSRSEPP
jgi:hypothetical protein